LKKKRARNMIKHTSVKHFEDTTFMCPCIANIISNNYQQDASFLNLFISTDAPHV